MSSSPRTAIGACIYGAGAAPKVGYSNGCDGVTPLSHAGMFSGACSDYRLTEFSPHPTRHAADGPTGIT